MADAAAEKPKMQKDDKLLTPQGVADLMGLKKREVYNLIAEGYFVCYYPTAITAIRTPGRLPFARRQIDGGGYDRT